MKNKTYIVILDDRVLEKMIYLGQLDRGVYQGVFKRDNATRFTRIGAYRVAAHYPGSRVVQASPRGGK